VSASGCEDERVTVTRLVTRLDVNDHNTDAHSMSVSARHEAELADGRRVLLLDGRGWTSSSIRFSVHEVPAASVSQDSGDIWAATSLEDIEETGRVVVGPDEPFAGRSREDMDADHWRFLAEVLRKQGVVVDARELKQLPHDVVLSERLLARTRGETQ
jgi:hypothetical protein